MSEHGIVVVRVSIQFVDNDEIKSLIKTHQLVCGRKRELSVFPAFVTASVKGSERGVRKSFGQTRSQFQHHIPARCSDQSPSATIQCMLEQGEYHFRLAGPGHGPQQEPPRPIPCGRPGQNASAAAAAALCAALSPHRASPPPVGAKAVPRGASPRRGTALALHCVAAAHKHGCAPARGKPRSRRTPPGRRQRRARAAWLRCHNGGSGTHSARVQATRAGGAWQALRGRL